VFLVWIISFLLSKLGLVQQEYRLGKFLVDVVAFAGLRRGLHVLSESLYHLLSFGFLFQLVLWAAGRLYGILLELYIRRWLLGSSESAWWLSLRLLTEFWITEIFSLNLVFVLSDVETLSLIADSSEVLVAYLVVVFVGEPFEVGSVCRWLGILLRSMSLTEGELSLTRIKRHSLLLIIVDN